MSKSKSLLLVNLGTPNKPTYFSVFSYLREFLSDYRVLDVPGPIRFILVNFIICPFRSLSSSKLYKKLWKRNNSESPLIKHANTLKSILNDRLDDYEVFYAMRYQNPSLKNVINSIMQSNPSEIVVFPLFPQYASSTTGSVFEAFTKELSKYWVVPKVTFINQFYTNHKFISAWANKLSSYDLDAYDNIVFSYHGLPNSHVDKVYMNGLCADRNCESDFNEENKFCYKAASFHTTKLIQERLGLNSEKCITCFQSRLTKNWLTPFTDSVLEELAANNHKKILVLAPAFTADNLETLIEIDDEYKELFVEAGGHTLDFVESLNDDEEWVQAIINILGETNV